MRLICPDPWCSVSNLVLSKQCLICISILDHLSYKWGNKYFINHSKILLFIRQITGAYSLNFPKPPKSEYFLWPFWWEYVHSTVEFYEKSGMNQKSVVIQVNYYFIFSTLLSKLHLNVQNSNDYSLTFKNYLYFCEQYLKEPGLLCT